MRCDFIAENLSLSVIAVSLSTSVSACRNGRAPSARISAGKGDRRTLNIRAANPGDVKAMSELMIGLTQKYIAGDCSAEGADHLLQLVAPAAIEVRMQSSYDYHLAEEDHYLAGIIAMKDHKHLYQLFVAETWHNRGVARRLWEFALERSLGQGNPGEFTVNSSMYARPVYERFGFVPTSGKKEDGGVVYQPMKLCLGRKDDMRSR